MKIKFIIDYQVKDAEGKSYLKDGVYDLPDNSALHFIKRRRAVKYIEPPAEPANEKEAEKIIEALPEKAEEKPPPVSDKPKRGIKGSRKKFSAAQDAYRKKELVG
jgi:hypothetical protein